jgi:hypothetical protein
LALAVGLFLVSRAGSRMVTPDDPAFGFAKVAFLSLVRMTVVVAALAAYFIGARPGFAFFGVTLVVSFIFTLGVEAVRLSRRVSPQR